MSSARVAVETIRRATVEPHTHLREEMRGSESKPEQTRTNPEEQDSESAQSHHPSSLPIKPLTARQHTAINLLAMGKTVTATAKTLGIGVSTLHRWKATHPLFRVELGRRQHDLFDSMIGKLRQTMGKAVDELFSMMSSGQKSERREVMWQMIKLLKPQKYLVPDTPQTLNEVLDEQIRARRAANGEVAEAEITDEERLAAIPSEFRTDDAASLADSSTSPPVTEKAEDTNASLEDAEPARTNRQRDAAPAKPEEAPDTTGCCLCDSHSPAPIPRRADAGSQTTAGGA